MKSNFLTTVIAGICMFSVAHAQGAFTTAAEVKPIMSMTKGSWVAVRDWEGQDLLYFTHIEAWRCGLSGVKFGINSTEVDTVYKLEDCHEDTNTPNAMLMEDHLPYLVFEAGSIETVTVEVTYDDGTTDIETFERKAIMTP